MRTIEEIKTSIARIKEESRVVGLVLNKLTAGAGITAHSELIRNLVALTNQICQDHQDLVQIQEAEISRLRQQCEWQPIETAPRDGTVIELIAPMSEYPRIGKWVDFPSFVFRGVREPGISKWVDANLTFPEIKNPTLWRPIPPLPQPKENNHAHD